MKKFEANVGIGLNMFFPETITIVIEDEVNEEPVKKRGRKPKTVKKEIDIEKE
jgi:hypothetical protein